VACFDFAAHSTSEVATVHLGGGMGGGSGGVDGLGKINL